MDCTGKIKKWIEKRRLIRPGDSITAAVSGGPDSMAMLAVLIKLAPELNLEVSAATFNHMIREEAEKETELVAAFCNKHNIPLFTGAADVPAEAERLGIGIEEAARELRYSFLMDTAAESGSVSVALGHNLNDQAETVLHHIIRGSGLAGLAGIPPQRGIFIRPVLCCSRGEIEEYIKTNGIPFAVDRSNFDTSYLRNRIRKELLPDLEAGYNPSITESLGRLAENLSEMIIQFRDEMDSILQMEMENGSVNIDLDIVDRMSDFQIYLLADRVCAEYFDLHQDIMKCHFDAVKSLVRNSVSGKEVTLPHGLKVSKEQFQIRFSKQDKPGIPPPLTIPSEGVYEAAAWGFRVEIRRMPAPEPGSLRATERQAFFSGIEFPLVIRSREAGDRIQPFGMKGRKKVSDLMIDSRVALHRRSLVPVIEDRRGIIWIPGLATSELTRVSSYDADIIRISLEGRNC